MAPFSYHSAPLEIPHGVSLLARAQRASAHRLAAELDDEVPVLPTHGFGSFCSSSQVEGDATTIGKKRATNDALTLDVDTFVVRPGWRTCPPTTRTWARPTPPARCPST